ncbi:MAG: peptide-methionine (R)-S-oxide reductase [Clostridia bacterium]|nr:peptide-methionine (R)-S-oxide reductase [Clostridia bacterium]NCC42688.1 peptide-methionine (R)-S-oxide reductase [Clostridia bacterium]
MVKRKFFITCILLLFTITLSSCRSLKRENAGQNAGDDSNNESNEDSAQKEAAMKNNDLKDSKEIYLAGGCFWGMEKLAKALPGVEDTTVGYANGTDDTTPTYESVCAGGTGFKETVRVVYDPKSITLEQIISAFFLAIDPQVHDRQGNDVGGQYQTGIYYTAEDSEAVVEKIITQEEKRYKNFAVEHEKLTRFYDAETYHQDYLEKNPAGYCHFSQSTVDEIAELIKAEQSYAKMDEKKLKENLTEEQYEVTQNAGTERPFTGEYWEADEKGIYVDITTGQPLFSSNDKYGSECGWPSFTAPILAGSVNYSADSSHNMDRTEVTSANGDAHLGHVFYGDPGSPNGTRYCINSASLNFIPESEMESQGYGPYLILFK